MNKRKTKTEAQQEKREDCELFVFCVIFWVLFGILLASSGCNTPLDGYYGNYRNATSYVVKMDRTTPGGVHVGGKIDDYAVDRLVDAVELCLAVVPEPTAQERLASDCGAPGPIRRDVDRALFDVFAPPDVYRSQCSGAQLFSCGVDPIHCAEKHLPPEWKCPCACRGAIQDDHTIVTVPDMPTFAAELTRLVTNCNNTWLGPLYDCAAIRPVFESSEVQ